jgi:hypothetical protein
LAPPSSPPLAALGFAQGNPALFALGHKEPFLLCLAQHPLGLHLLAKALEQLFL